MGRQESNPLGQIVGMIVFLGALFYVFVWPPLVAWWAINGWIVLTILGIIGAFFLWLFLRWLFKGDNSSNVANNRRSYSETSTSYRPYSPHIADEFNPNTSISYDNHMKHQFDETRTEIVEMIQSFKPFRQYKSEKEYQIGLAHYLKTKFSETRIEEQKDSSRPDITIGKIAIEVKGPTTTRGLESIASKIVRYRNNFEDGLIIVLFDMQATERYYEEWHTGVKATWPAVEVVRI